MKMLISTLLIVIRNWDWLISLQMHGSHAHHLSMHAAAAMHDAHGYNEVASTVHMPHDPALRLGVTANS